MNKRLKSLYADVCKLTELNDEALADRVYSDNSVQWCLAELQYILETFGDDEYFVSKYSGEIE